MQKRAVERKKERNGALLLVFDKYKKESDNSKCVNGSPITIQKTDKNTKSMDEKS